MKVQIRTKTMSGEDPQLIAMNKVGRDQERRPVDSWHSKVNNAKMARVKKRTPVLRRSSCFAGNASPSLGQTINGLLYETIDFGQSCVPL